jgi:hypothetical protein
MRTHRDRRRSRLGRRARTSTGSAPRAQLPEARQRPSDSATSSSSTGRRSTRTARRSESGLNFLVLAADGRIERDYTFVVAWRDAALLAEQEGSVGE